MHHNGGSFWADPFELQQPAPGFFGSHIPQKVQVEVSSQTGDLPQHVLQSRTFLVRQACRTDCGDDLGWVGVADFLPGRKGATESVESAIAIGIVGVLRKDRRS